jgi:hypothetical protein
MSTTLSTGHHTRHFKEKFVEEFKVYWVVFAFLALMFGAFTNYRRLILHGVGINYAHWGAGLIQAAIIAKVILIGQAMHVGRRIERHPLIVAAVVKSLLYGLLVAVFNILEHAVEGLIHGDSWPAIAHRLVMSGPDEILARFLMIFIAFIPFFALWETGRVIGFGRLADLFFHKRAA